MVNYPTSLDTGSTLPNPTGTSTQNSPDHASLHTSENAAIIAAETKLGTGSSTPASNTLLIGTGAGTSSWSQLTSAQLAAILSDETGTGAVVFANTPTLITPKVDTINENTPGNGVTVAGVNLKSGFMSGANLTAGTVGNSQLATGVCVQVVSTTFSAVATGTTITPFDDTIPQITEGTEFMTQAITPKATTNLLEIAVTCFVQVNVVSNNPIMALHQDSTANALAATTMAQSTAVRSIMALTHTMTAGTTSATTFRVRIGNDTAATVTFNGNNSARIFGTAVKSSIVIREYKV